MPANVKLPSGHKADWPPKGFAYAKAVHAPPGLNWWSLAWAVGRDNPWDLIIYNFETEDPREVNWYLQDYVGCKKLNGSNYVFDGAKPGIVYIPPTSWHPSTKYKKGSSRRHYPSYIATQVASIIRKAANICPKVTGFGYSISTFDLIEVADQVDAKKIHCHIAPEIYLDGAVGKYYTGDEGDFEGNSFYFIREPHQGSVDMVATVAHESVHASFDARKIKDMYLSSNEMIGYAVDALIMARLFPKTVEQRLSLAVSGKAHPDHSLLLFGWALKEKGFVDLDTLRTAPNVEDPFFGTDVNLYSKLYYYVYHRNMTKWKQKMINDGL